MRNHLKLLIVLPLGLLATAVLLGDRWSEVRGIGLASWFVRHDLPERPVVGAFILSFMRAGPALTGWLGGELLDRLGVGVDDGARCTDLVVAPANPLSRIWEYQESGSS